MKSSEFRSILKKLGKNNIAIIGHMGSGKSVMGKIFANKFGFKHVDSDKKIIKLTNKPINIIFDEKGENFFRNIEKKVVLNLIDKKSIVLSLGGGSILDMAVRNKLKKKSLTLFLDVNLKELEKRLKRSFNRPLLKNTDINEKMKKLDTERRKYYLLADIIIQNANTPIDTFKNFIKEFSIFNEKTNSYKN